jgi:DNA-binding NtrC family response regulator
MPGTLGHILLADDDATYRTTMTELLRAEGYEVTTVTDGAAAFAAAERDEFDLLLADLEMPGNEDLALVRGVARRHGNLPIIIVTGFPSMRTAMSCIQLPVTAYLLKPVEFDELKGHVGEAVARYRSFRRADERLEQWRRDLAQMTAPSAGVGTEAFMRLALRNAMGSLADLDELAGRARPEDAATPHTCQVLNCPRGMQLGAAIRETIQVLEETRTSFKSTQRRDLRRKLALMMEYQ